MLAQSRHDESLNLLTDDLLKRGIASTKLDAKRLAQSMMGDITATKKPVVVAQVQQSAAQPTAQHSTTTHQINSAVQDQLSRTQRQINSQDETIKLLREELTQIKEQHNFLHTRMEELHSHMDKHMMQQSPDTLYDSQVQVHTLDPEANNIREQHEQEEEEIPVQNEIRDELLNIENTTEISNNDALIPNEPEKLVEEKKEESDDVDLTNLFSNS